MNLLKKLFILILIFACGGIIYAGVTASSKNLQVKAEQTPKLNTELFLPSSYFEYYKLSSPIDVCEDENYVYVAENNALVIFDKNANTYKRISLTANSNPISGITKIDCYKGFVFVLESSQIFYLSRQDYTQDVTQLELTKADITVSNYFAIYGDFIYVNTSSSITVSKIEGTDALTFKLSATYDSDRLQNTSTNALAYSSSTNFLYYFTLNGCTKRILASRVENGEIFTQTTYYAKALNGKLYYTCNNMFYEFNESTLTNRALFDLNEFCSSSSAVKGFSIYEGKILIVLSNSNEVMQYDLSSGYTGISIATTKNAVNRLTENVVDICYENDYVFALQKESILRFSTTSKNYAKFNFEDTDFNIESFSPKYFSISNGKLLLSNGNDLLAFSFKEEGGKIICEKLTIEFPNDWDYNSITGLYAFDGNFYLLKNKTIDNVQNAIIIKLVYNESNGVYSINSSNYVYQTMGNGQSFSINAFGELYLLLKNSDTSKKVVCYDLVNKKQSENQTTFSSAVTKIFCDFENVFCLENNSVYNLTKNQTYLISNERLTDGSPVSITTDLINGKTYILYAGYILKTADLPLTTPSSFQIPQELYTTYYQNVRTFNLSEGAKLFEVSASDNYFDYKNVTSSEDLQYVFVSELSNNFCLINLKFKSYIARTTDLISYSANEQENLAQTFNPSFSSGYFVTRAGLYGLPILNFEQYSSTNTLGVFRLKTIGAYTKVEILDNGVIINGEKFYRIKYGETTGYIQTSFIVQKINYFLADVKSAVVYDLNGTQIGNVSPRKVKVYGKDNDMFVIEFNGGYGYVLEEAINTDTTNRENFFLATIKDTTFTSFNGEQIAISSQQVKIFGEENGKYIIEYQDQYGYIPTNSVIQPKNNAIKNSLVVIILATNFLVTALFLQIKFNRKYEL